MPNAILAADNSSHPSARHVQFDENGLESPIIDGDFSTPLSSPLPPLDNHTTMSGNHSFSNGPKLNDSTTTPPFVRRASNTRPQFLSLSAIQDESEHPEVILDLTSPSSSTNSPSIDTRSPRGHMASSEIGNHSPHEPLHRMSSAPPHNSLVATRPSVHPLRQSHSHIQHHSDSTNTIMPSAMKSPCFVHSHLDKGVSFQDWLNQTRLARDKSSSSLLGDHPQRPFGVERALSYKSDSSSQSPSSIEDEEEDEEDDEGAGSLTRQLAETAVGVREMSKQLGRARVRSSIQNVLIITKARDNNLIKLTRELALYLMKKPRDGGRGLVVYVDNQLRTSKRFDAAGIERDHPELFVPFPKRRTSSSNSLVSMSTNSANEPLRSPKLQDPYKDAGQLRYWTSDMCSRSPHLFDFVVTLGGDGTVLFTSWLFQRIVPPVLPFALGSLGFLTNFDFADYASVMDSAIDNGIRVNLRMRFTCTVYRAVAPEDGKGSKAVKKADTGEILMKNVEKEGWEALEGGAWSGSGNVGACKKDREIMCFTTRPVESFEVLNDLVVDRGPSPYVSLLELFGDEHHMTTVQADGLTIATPTGSTAYSLSAGGSLVHPEIPAILITPICPHTLSFRPMLLPDTMELRICVPYNSRSTAWASFDGRGRVELKQGDHIKVTASKFPFPTVCADKQSTDWFHAISRTLKWNERERQKSFVVVEEGPAKEKKRSSSKTRAAGGPEKIGAVQSPPAKPEEQAEDEDEEKFDIDDSSPEASAAAASASSTSSINTSPSDSKLPSPVFDTMPKRQKTDPALADAKAAFKDVVDPHVYSLGGTDSPDRFASRLPHPPSINPRHLSHTHEAQARSAAAPQYHHRLRGEEGARDDIHSPLSARTGTKSRIPKDRDVEGDSMRTPRPERKDHLRAGHHPHPNTHPTTARNHRRVGSLDSANSRRAFAVWGQDESDSATSDSDVV